MTLDQLKSALDEGSILRLSRADATALLEAAELVERHATPCCGPLLILRLDGRIAALEQPSRSSWALRSLRREEVRRFVDERLAAYERLWDG